MNPKELKTELKVMKAALKVTEKMATAARLVADHLSDDVANLEDKIQVLEAELAA